MTLPHSAYPIEKHGEITDLIGSLLEADRGSRCRARNKFAESSLDILVIFNLLVVDYASELMAREAILLQVMDLVKEAGAEFAFPTRTLYVDSIQGQSSPKADQDFLGVADQI